MRNYQYPILKAVIYCSAEEIEGLRGDPYWYAAQASPLIDAARAEMYLFRTETRDLSFFAGVFL
jgi:hypothetical protein